MTDLIFILFLCWLCIFKYSYQLAFAIAIALYVFVIHTHLAFVVVTTLAVIIYVFQDTFLFIFMIMRTIRTIRTIQRNQINKKTPYWKLLALLLWWCVVPPIHCVSLIRTGEDKSKLRVKSDRTCIRFVRRKPKDYMSFKFFEVRHNGLHEMSGWC